MKNPLIATLFSILTAGFSLAESRTFTNKDGKTISAGLVRVDGETAVMKLANSKLVNVPVASLSDSDQEFVKTWWEKNKNNVTEMDVRLTIDKKSDRISTDKDDSKNKGKKGGPKVTVSEFTYHCELSSYTPRELTDITVNYTVHKRVSTRDKEGSKVNTETVDGSETIAKLAGNQKATFETTAVRCEDISPGKPQGGKGNKGGNKGGGITKRETILGVVFTLSANGNEFLVQSYPDNFSERLADAEENED